MPARMKIDKNSVEKAILIALLAGAIVISPMGGRVVIGLAAYYLKKWWEKGGPYVPPEKDPEKVRESIYKLKRNEYINWQYDNKKNIVTLELTEKGRKVFGKVQFDDLTISPSKEWDKKWRFLVFDIPEKRKTLRDILRAKLKAIGFFQFQKSVWIYPFECEKEISYVCEYLGATSFTMMFTAAIGNDKILRKYFYDRGILPKKYLYFRDKYIRA